MKNGFTIIEVSILLIIFLIVAFLVAPLSLDDTMQAKNTSRWRNVQADFSNIFYSAESAKAQNNLDFKIALENVISGDIKTDVKNYRITFLNNTYPDENYRFNNFKLTNSNATLAIKYFDDSENSTLKGMLMYDVNGITGPNTWGKDVFGMNIYEDRFEPFCKADKVKTQAEDCSKTGTGLCCSNYYLIGGSFD